MKYTDIDGHGVPPVLVTEDADALVASATGAAGALAPALAAVAGTRNFLSGFLVTGSGATAASVIDVTITGLLGGTITMHIPVPAGATAAITPINVQLARPLPASAANTAITLNVPSFGAGNTDASAIIFGFRRATG